jgi:hypothetical protein
MLLWECECAVPLFLLRRLWRRRPTLALLSLSLLSSPMLLLSSSSSMLLSPLAMLLSVWLLGLRTLAVDFDTALDGMKLWLRGLLLGEGSKPCKALRMAISGGIMPRPCLWPWPWPCPPKLEPSEDRRDKDNGDNEEAEEDTE